MKKQKTYFNPPQDPKRRELINKLRRIIVDLERGYDGFMYLYDELC